MAARGAGAVGPGSTQTGLDVPLHLQQGADEVNFMLKTRITEQYGLKVPFINAGMAFIATAPLVRAVCKAGGISEESKGIGVQL